MACRSSSWHPLPLLLVACQASAPSDADRISVRIALCQIEVDAQPDVNLKRIEAAIATAAVQDADLVCFPEACVFGWVNPAAHASAAPIPGATTDRIGALAARHGVMVVLGLAEQDGDRLHNSVVLIDTDGSVLLRHRKVNILSELMDPPYTPGPGAEDCVVDTRLGRIGLLICADTFKEPLVDQLAEQEPDLVVVPYGWAAPAEAWPDHGKSLQAWVANTARRCQAPVVGVDSTGAIHGGPWKGYVLGGQSVLCGADGQVLDVLPDRTPAVRTHEVKLKRDRHRSPVESNGGARSQRCTRRRGAHLGRILTTRVTGLWTRGLLRAAHFKPSFIEWGHIRSEGTDPANASRRQQSTRTTGRTWGGSIGPANTRDTASLPSTPCRAHGCFRYSALTCGSMGTADPT